MMKYIETDRLILRDWKKADLKPFAMMNQDPMVLQFLPIALSVAETRSMIRKFQNYLTRYGYGRFACEEKGTSQFIGFIGLGPVQLEKSYIEIGWRLASTHWGKGYATEAAREVLARSFSDYGLEEVISFTVPGNVRSRRVMEKIGLIHDINGDFHHPLLPRDHPLSKHVLYRLRKESYSGLKFL